MGRIKKKEVWAEYESRCNKSMEIAKLIDKLDKRAERGEKTVEEAWQKVKKAARKLEIWMEEIAEEKGDLEYEYINKQIRSERDIAEKIERETEAWNQLKECEDEEYKKILRKRYNNCKNVLNKARKKLRRIHKREVVREIEKLSTRYPGEFWRLLKQLSGRKKKERKTMKTMIDEEGFEVEGAEIQRVWKEAFEKLGKKGGQETFDEKFTESVEKVDICCVTETHLDEKRERLLISILEDKFECLSRIREERKRGDYGSRGVAVMIRKTKGKIKTIKRKGADGILWVEVEGTGRKMFVAVVYIVPTKSTRYVKNTELRRELEEDNEIQTGRNGNGNGGSKQQNRGDRTS